MAKKKTEQAVTNSQEFAEQQTEVDSSNAPNGNIIEPVAVDITLRAIHPQESYGRCGLRFKKGETQRIAFAAFEPDVLLALEADPWLELVYVAD